MAHPSFRQLTSPCPRAHLTSSAAEPTGRLKIASLANPFNMIAALLGPNIAKECCLCVCVLISFIAWIQVLPAVSSIITLLDKLPHQIEDNIAWILVISVFLCCIGCCRCYCTFKHRNDQTGDDDSSSDDDDDDDDDDGIEMRKRTVDQPQPY